jgi:hypothetical protein
MTEAIQKRGITVFNYLTANAPYESLEGQLHSPDLNMAGLSPADIAILSKFIKPGTNDKTVKQ